MSSTPPDFTGRVAVVTGAGSGIGRATARLLHRLGARVHVVDLNAGAVDAVRDELGPTAVSHTVDCSDAGAVEALAERVFAEEGAVDVLHSNAGIGHAGEIQDTTVEDWQRVIGLNLLGVAYAAQAFAPRMLRQGRPAHIVNTASVLGLVPAGGLAPYCTSKFGVVGMSLALNAELAPKGVHVTAVCPGIIDTGIIGSAVMRGDAAQRQEKATDFYAKRGASPDQVAQAVVDAVQDKALIQVVPRWQVLPGWIGQRVSPGLMQHVSRRLAGLMMR